MKKVNKKCGEKKFRKEWKTIAPDGKIEVHTLVEVFVPMYDPVAKSGVELVKFKGQPNQYYETVEIGERFIYSAYDNDKVPIKLEVPASIAIALSNANPRVTLYDRLHDKRVYLLEEGL